MTEHQIERSIWELLTHYGYFCFKHKDHAARINGSYRKCPMQINGVADLCVFYQGRVAYLEVKKPGGKQSGAQIEFERQCKRNGIEYYVVTSAKEALNIIKPSA